MKRPVEPMPMDHHMRVRVTKVLRTYLEVDTLLRSNSQSIRSSPPPDNAEGRAYQALCREHRAAYADLWLATDFEFEEDGFRDVVWNWRYWKIMARKCCWYQTQPMHGFMASKTMRQMYEAEAKMVEACGLTSIYRSSCSFLEEHFPNLKSVKNIIAE